MKIKKSFYIVMAIWTFCLLYSTNLFAANYVLWVSSVDSWEIRWWWSTKYSTQLTSAISTWNAMWSISIAADTASTIEDIQIKDVTVANSSWTWRTTFRIGSDLVEINKAYLENQSNSPRTNTFLHELWHTLGLADHNVINNVMYSSQTAKTSLWTQDKADYNYLW